MFAIVVFIFTETLNTLFRGNSLATKSVDEFMKVTRKVHLNYTHFWGDYWGLLQSLRSPIFHQPTAFSPIKTTLSTFSAVDTVLCGQRKLRTFDKALTVGPLTRVSCDSLQRFESTTRWAVWKVIVSVVASPSSVLTKIFSRKVNGWNQVAAVLSNKYTCFLRWCL